MPHGWRNPSPPKAEPPASSNSSPPAATSTRHTLWPCDCAPQQPHRPATAHQPSNSAASSAITQGPFSPGCPPVISLATPKASRAVQVAIDPRALTAVLDNLVGNAIEALHQGGHISLAWIADAYEAVIEISDDGPGLPSDIAAALAAGQRIRSTKPGGNGLGLLSARSLLTRAGGQLAHGRTSTGTAWFITLPRDPATFPEPA
ncbi:ATP-binding protein [Streptomyces prasinus]|uniref:ATP-binding protein n=1 Tax=Streptomyces prasinus TaxID=67345 RepID=UPI0037D6F63F